MLHENPLFREQVDHLSQKIWKFSEKNKKFSKFKLNIFVRDRKGVKIYNRNFGKNIK